MSEPASSPRPFPATPLHPRRPQPSAQPSSLIPSGFCSPHISRHSLATTPSAAVRAASSLIPSGFFSQPISSQSLAPTPSAAVRAAKLAHPQRLLLPTHFHPLPSAAVAQPSSLIPSGFFFPPISSHSLHPRRPQPYAQPSSLIPSWLHGRMGGEKKPLGTSELGCADGCGRGCADGFGRQMGGEKKPPEISELASLNVSAQS